MKLIITGILLTFFLNAFSQKAQNVYFFKKNGDEVKTKDSADYIRIIREPDSAAVFFNLTEYFVNGKKKRIALVSSFAPSLKLEGTVTTFYENGLRKSIVNYKGNKLLGESIYYHENGKLKEVRVYDKETNTVDLNNDLKYRVINITDSTGNKLLDNLGNGQVTLNKENGDTESGAYLNGVKNGVWKEFVAKEKIEYYDMYENGKFIKGEYKTASGETQAYTIKDQLPEFKGGMKGFASFLSRTFNRPSESWNNNEKGRVVLNFFVEADGSLSNIKVVKSASPLLDEEALRVLSKSPKWSPAIYRGKAIGSSYTLPIVLN